MNHSALIDGLKQGDRIAFRQLVEAYQDRVYNTVLAIVRQPEEAEDVAQEVFVQVFRSIREFDGGQNLTAWLYRIDQGPRSLPQTPRPQALGWGVVCRAGAVVWLGRRR